MNCPRCGRTPEEAIELRCSIEGCGTPPPAALVALPGSTYGMHVDLNEAASEARATGDAADEISIPYKPEPTRIANQHLIDAARSTGAVPAETLKQWRMWLLGHDWAAGDTTPGICLKIADAIAAALNGSAATGAAGEPQPAERVGDTRFEGWLSCHEPDRTDGRRCAYTKQDMRRSYWAGYTERSTLAAVPQADSGAAGGQGDKP